MITRVHLFFWLLLNSLNLLSAKPQVTALDALIPQFRALTDAAYSILTPYAQSKENFRNAQRMRKLQPTLNDGVPFPCNTNNSRSQIRPTTIHALRPGDIDVIGALGDSITAGNGLVATDLMQTVLQNRGLSFSGGGESNWRRFTTLPNILKEFNPQLVGYATKDSYINHVHSQLNVADAGAMSVDMPFMSNELIRRVKNHPHINFQEDWKMITILIGPNDFCGDMCYKKDPEIIIENHRTDLLKTLRNLRDNLPRTFVNLILVPHLKIMRNVSVKNRPSVCYFTHNILCPCLFGLQFSKSQKKFDEIMDKWRIVEKEVAELEEFDRDDFTVVLQTFAKYFDFKKRADGLNDYSVFSYDCFHLSQKEHGRAATSLWNNLLEPEGSKAEALYDVFNFSCPTVESPYIRTRRNSIKYSN